MIYFLQIVILCLKIVYSFYFVSRVLCTSVVLFFYLYCLILCYAYMSNQLIFERDILKFPAALTDLFCFQCMSTYFFLMNSFYFFGYIIFTDIFVFTFFWYINSVFVNQSSSFFLPQIYPMRLILLLQLPLDFDS